ncbi:MAG: ribonuclease PH [Planctomycetes bacterium]|nr:ribonuclease PH [Planctomycetota bacterium]
MTAKPAEKFRRHDGRGANELRPMRFVPDFVRTADGSCLIEMGGTRVICTACFVPGVPEWRKNSGQGWMTAEYGMLPASTSQRKVRPAVKPDGRSVEIQRLIGRALRSVVDMSKLADNTIYLDCDVLEADGGTRTAAINGAWVALALAAGRGRTLGKCKADLVTGGVAAVSAGIVGGRAVLDLDYREDSGAAVDMNVVMTGDGRFVEVQGTAEHEPFGDSQLAGMLALARKGIRDILRHQELTIKADRKK